MPTYLKISNNTTSDKHSSNDIGAVFVSGIFFTASLRFCWARVILLKNAFPRDCAFIYEIFFFFFVTNSLPSRQISPTRGTQTRAITRCFNIKKIPHVFHNILNNTIPARRRFATTDVTFLRESHRRLKHFKGFIFFIKLPATTRGISCNAHAYFFKFSSDKWKQWSSSLSCPPETLVGMG